MTWRTRLKPDCCRFGRKFPPEHDDEFLRMSIREAARHFSELAGGEWKVSKAVVEEHHKCLAPRHLDGGRMDPLVDSVAKADVEEAVKAIQQMTPEQLERDQRINFIMKLVDMNEWHGNRTLRALGQKWAVSDESIYRYMREAQRRLDAGRGGVLFDKQVSIRYTTMLRNEAKEAGDLKAALLAQKHLDALTGALAPPAVQVNQQINQHVNIVSHPLFQQIFEAIAEELREFPDAFERVQARLESETRRLPGGSRGVIDVDVVEPLHGGA